MRMRVTGKNGCFESDYPPEVVLAMQRVGDVFEMAGARPPPGGDPNDPESLVEVTALRNALIVVRDRVRKSRGAEEYVYITSCWMPGEGREGTDLLAEGAGTMSGFHIHGDLFAVVGGYNKCVLQRIGLKRDGTGEIVEERDVRHLKHIDTDDWGRITIKKRRAAGDVEKWINALLRKLKKLDGEILVEFA